MLKIGFISYFHPEDKKSSSGTNYKILEQLKEIGDITWLPVKFSKISVFPRLINKVWNKTLGKKFGRINLFCTKTGCRLIYKLYKPNYIKQK